MPTPRAIEVAPQKNPSSRWQVLSLLSVLAGVPACAERTIDEGPEGSGIVPLEEMALLDLENYPGIVDERYFMTGPDGIAYVVGCFSHLDWILNPENIEGVLAWTRIRVFQDEIPLRELRVELDGCFDVSLWKGNYQLSAHVIPPREVLIEGELDEEGFVSSDRYSFTVTDPECLEFLRQGGMRGEGPCLGI